MDLSTRTGAFTMLTGLTCDAVHPGQIEPSYIESRFIAALYGVATRDLGDGDTVDDLLMPPDQPLSTSEIELIERWFAAGAKCD